MVLDQSRTAALLHWAEVNHTSLHPHVEIYQDPVTGLSFRAVENIPKDDNLVNCSYHTVLSYLNAIDACPQFSLHGSPSFPVEFLNTLEQDNPHIIGHFFLIQQYLMGEKSFWWNYIRLLPQPDQPRALAIPIWWPEADQDFLDGTNAGPPVRLKQRIWREEWEQGINLLKDSRDNFEAYTYTLYKWAATIFGTRSFRASLTIPQELIRGSCPTVEEETKLLDRIRQDRFSALLPVMDIGNHDGLDFVKWIKAPEKEHFILSTCRDVRQGDQIYNFYGFKSNSELLVGYGFTLPLMRFRDVVNLKLTPTFDAAELRRSQTCHIRPRQDESAGEFMSAVQQRRTHPERRERPILCLGLLQHGLFETMVCMVANARERLFIQGNPAYCLDRDDDMFSNPLYRAIFRVLPILSAKLESEIGRIRDTGAKLSKPQNENQKLALDYRTRQLAVLENALPPVINQLRDAASFSSFCGHPHHQTSLPQSDQNRTTIRHPELLSLECAFDWLRIHYPDIYDLLVRIIAEDQEEPLPLNWAILVEDWDNVYWIAWIYVIWKLWALDKDAFEPRHGNLIPWMLEMNSAYSYESFCKEDGGQRGDSYSDPSEQETINHTIQQIGLVPQLNDTPKPVSPSWENLRNFASLVSSQETIPAAFNMQQHGPVEQKLLVVLLSKTKDELSEPPI